MEIVRDLQSRIEVKDVMEEEQHVRRHAQLQSVVEVKMKEATELRGCLVGVYIYIYMYVYMCVHMCVCVYIYIYTLLVAAGVRHTPDDIVLTFNSRSVLKRLAKEVCRSAVVKPTAAGLLVGLSFSDVGRFIWRSHQSLIWSKWKD